MENFFRVTGLLCGKFTGDRWIPLTKANDAEFWCFLWSAPWINGWVNNREAGDLRRHRAHYVVIVTFFHSLRAQPSVTYMRQRIGSALVQILSCRIYGAKQLSKPMLGQYRLEPINWTVRKKLPWNFNKRIEFFIQENAKVVCELAAILSRQPKISQ